MVPLPGAGARAPAELDAAAGRQRIQLERAASTHMHSRHAHKVAAAQVDGVSSCAPVPLPAAHAALMSLCALTGLEKLCIYPDWNSLNRYIELQLNTSDFVALLAPLGSLRRLKLSSGCCWRARRARLSSRWSCQTKTLTSTRWRKRATRRRRSFRT